MATQETSYQDSMPQETRQISFPLPVGLHRRLRHALLQREIDTGERITLQEFMTTAIEAKLNAHEAQHV